MSREVLLASLLLLVFSCTRGQYREPEFAVEHEKTFQIISDELYVNLTYDLWHYKSFLLVPVADLQTGHNLWIYNKSSGERIWSGINTGRGPGETIGGVLDTYFENGVLSFYDRMKGRVIRYEVDSILAGKFDFKEEVYDVPVWATKMIETGNLKLFVNNVGYESSDLQSISRFEMIDKSGEIMCKCDFHPIEDAQKRFFMYGTSMYSVSSEKRMMVVATSLGSILEVYEVYEDSVKLKNVNYFYEPDFDLIPGSYDFNERTVLGFNDVFATNDRIYTVYDGEVNPYWNDEDRLTYTKIAVFDWDGNPLELIHTDYKIDKIAYSEEDNTIYAAVKDRDGIMYLAKMEL